MVDMSDNTRIENKLDEIMLILTVIMWILAIDNNTDIAFALVLTGSMLILIARYVNG